MRTERPRSTSPVPPETTLRPELVALDFDGTLADTRAAVVATVNAALAAHGWPRLFPEVVHSRMGLPLTACFEVAIPPYRRPVDVAPMVAWSQEHFADLGAPLVELLPGTHAALAALRAAGVGVALVTNQHDVTLSPLLGRLGLTGPWTSVVTGDRGVEGKPQPEGLLLAVREAGASPGTTWWVGDTPDDVRMARAAGVRAVAVTTGGHDHDALVAAGAHTVLPDLTALARAVVGD